VNDSERQPNAGPAAAERRFALRVVGASLVFLALGLGAMWAYFTFRQEPGVGLETVAPLPPPLPAEKIAPDRIRLFFTADGTTLEPELREIGPADSIYERARAIVEALLKGPESRGLRSPIPAGTKLRALYVGEDSAVADFSADLREGLRGAGPLGEALCIYSIVNSVLVNCLDLRTLTILVDGRPVETLAGNLDVGAPLVADLALIAPEERQKPLPARRKAKPRRPRRKRN